MYTKLNGFLDLHGLKWTKPFFVLFYICYCNMSARDILLSDGHNEAKIPEEISRKFRNTFKFLLPNYASAREAFFFSCFSSR